MSSQAEEFEWTFPCYVLAKDVSISADGVIGASYAACELDGQACYLIFTDLDLAERCREDRGDPSLSAVPLQNSAELHWFLTLLAQQDSMIVVDLDFQSQRGRKFDIAGLLSRLGSTGA